MCDAWTQHGGEPTAHPRSSRSSTIAAEAFMSHAPQSRPSRRGFPFPSDPLRDAMAHAFCPSRASLITLAPAAAAEQLADGSKDHPTRHYGGRRAERRRRNGLAAIHGALVERPDVDHIPCVLGQGTRVHASAFQNKDEGSTCALEATVLLFCASQKVHGCTC